METKRDKRKETREKKEGMKEYWKNGMVVSRRRDEKNQETRDKRKERWNDGILEKWNGSVETWRREETREKKDGMVECWKNGMKCRDVESRRNKKKERWNGGILEKWNGSVETWRREETR